MDTQDLHLNYVLTSETEASLRRWDEAVAAEPPLQPIRWHLLERFLRSATVTASTQIEGNPLSLPQVDALLQGEPMELPHEARAEVLNYNTAMSVATSLALTPSFQWSEAILRMLNHQILRDLPDDRQGRYRDEPVSVGNFYRPPEAIAVPGLMSLLTAWLCTSSDHPLVRVALLHLNMAAIHPWLNGNGRTARVASSLDLMRSRVAAPELINIEPYLRAHQTEYFEMLQTTLGPSYSPDRHSATEWVNYYVNITAERLDFQSRLEDAWPHDLGTLTGALQEANHPTQWAVVLLLAAIAPIRTRMIADINHRTMTTARTLLSNIESAGYLERHGRTRAARYSSGPRLRALPLRSPQIIRLHVEGLTLGLDVA